MNAMLLKLHTRKVKKKGLLILSKTKKQWSTLTRILVIVLFVAMASQPNGNNTVRFALIL